MRKSSLERIAKEYRACNPKPEKEYLELVERFIEEGKLNETEVKVFRAGETIREKGDKATPYGISQITGINAFTVKEVLKGIALKILMYK